MILLLSLILHEYFLIFTNVEIDASHISAEVLQQ